MARKPALISNPIVTHLVAAALGVSVWWIAGRDGKTDGSASDQAATKDFRSSKRSDRTKVRLSGDELLKRIIGNEQPAQEIVYPSPATALSRRENLLKRLGRIFEKADAVEPADDVADAAKKALEAFVTAKGNNEQDAYQLAQIRLMHWLREDPRAALAFDFKPNDWGGYLRDAVSAAAQEAGIHAAIGWLGASPHGDTEIRRSLSMIAGAQGDEAAALLVKGSVSAARWGDMRSDMAGYWPMEKADSLVKLATEEKAPFAVLNFARGNGEAGFDWLRAQLASESFDPAMRTAIMKRQEYQMLFYNADDLPYEERFNALAEASPDQSRDEIKFSIGMRDVQKVLQDGTDWRYAFSQGTATFDEIYDTVAAKLPSLSTSAPEAIRNQLIKELAEDNGPAVIAELADLPADQKWEAAIKPARSMFYNVNPQHLYDYLQMIPADAGESVWEQRLQAWTNQTRTNRSRFDTAYVSWVEKLPEGLDREMAIFGLVTNGKDPEMSDALRAEIRDPKLVQRLEAKR